MLPVANPKLNLNDFAFNIVKVSPISPPLSQGSMHDTAQTCAAPEWQTCTFSGLVVTRQRDSV